jgi:hypothetical protein
MARGEELTDEQWAILGCVAKIILRRESALGRLLYAAT